MTPTAEQFATARFATHPDGRIAARLDDDGFPWVGSGEAFRDAEMPAEGFVPLSESLPSTPTDEMVERYLEAMRHAKGQDYDEEVRVGLAAALSAAPVNRRVDPQMTDENALRVAWAAYRKVYQPIAPARSHEAFCEGWKAREKWQEDAAPAPMTDDANDIDWQVVAEHAEAEMDEAREFAALWKETARYLWKSRKECERFEAKAKVERDEARRRDKETREDWQITRDILRTAQERIGEVERDRDAAQAVADDALARAEKAEQKRDEARTIAASRLGQRENTMTAREHLDAAWSAAHVPADGIIPAGAETIYRHEDGRIESHLGALFPRQESESRRLLDPPTPKRPEGAEALDALIDAWKLVAEPRPTLPDFLAERGVRVTEDGEGER